MYRALIYLLLTCNLPGNCQDSFIHFEERAMRIDFYLAGNQDDTEVFLDQIKSQPFWGGSKTNLIDTFMYGNFMIEVMDTISKKVIYSRGFSTLFNEWQTTQEAKELNRSYYQSVLIPFPRETVNIKILERTESGLFTEIFHHTIDPGDYFILEESVSPSTTTKVHDSGDPSRNLDILFLAEGYTIQEMEKFKGDVRRFTNILFDTSPYDDYKEKINIWMVESVSEESGTDIPGEGIYRNTRFNSTYYTFDLPRYLTTSDMKRLHDEAAGVPYDQIVLLINSERYGGGGIFNHYSAVTADHLLSPEVFVHELGHGFAGLGDEYYSSAVAYESFYNLETEPWEPNLTTLVNFENKWDNMLPSGITIPTPPESAAIYPVGVFEGGGYVSTGIYRPAFDCRMKSNEAEGFCEVCKRAISQMILFYSH